MVPARPLVERFAAHLDALVAPGERLGVAVSGGPDSLALLLLAAAARPHLVEAATVDHRLRTESREETDFVGELCARLQVPHSVLTVHWPELPQTAVQEAAREARYALLGGWAADHALPAIATGHHADDQAETVMMRLARGAGVRGLAGMRARSPVPGHPDILLIRPLLDWRRAELERICAEMEVTPIADPSNDDLRFERVRMRRALEKDGLPVPEAVARSAGNLAAADEALDWATDEVWERVVRSDADDIAFDPSGIPDEIRRRLLLRILAQLANEGPAHQFRARELDRMLAQLDAGEAATLRGVRGTGGALWRFAKAPARRAR